MTQTIEALFDGKSLHVKEPLSFAPNTVVRVTVETIETSTNNDFFAACIAANLDDPSDWSENLEEYKNDEQNLNGTAYV
jgi:hypothetical protein